MRPQREHTSLIGRQPIHAKRPDAHANTPRVCPKRSGTVRSTSNIRNFTRACTHPRREAQTRSDQQLCLGHLLVLGLESHLAVTLWSDLGACRREEGSKREDCPVKSRWKPAQDGLMGKCSSDLHLHIKRHMRCRLSPRRCDPIAVACYFHA
ncbi:hypothetical protein IE81DRAFT_31945 [Ceraceosorus guamensis]|uniref:Uncharacterized protein n=1 Tax=Ceraceosorus guamensis TaxID=1522189 RepID=A0A316VSL5_9BASI|nr:hypothetical protein IE81DRAFT_31945 [Ceraceosorus guamensis]PWN39403.1 hypothetical protein IE81DRAFT_31945 [Ceraceosorus guamensis]